MRELNYIYYIYGARAAHSSCNDLKSPLRVKFSKWNEKTSFRRDKARPNLVVKKFKSTKIRDKKLLYNFHYIEICTGGHTEVRKFTKINLLIQYILTLRDAMKFWYLLKKYVFIFFITDYFRFWNESAFLFLIFSLSF